VENPTPESLRQSLTRSLQRLAVTDGEIALPAVPAMIDDYVRMCDSLFAALGAQFSPGDLAQLRSILSGQLSAAYAASPRSKIVITYQVPVGFKADYVIKARWYTVQEAYDNWVGTRQPPLFGTEPDARVCALAAEASQPAAFPVLDVGAGTGRNSLALARRGHPVDALEMAGKLADIIRGDARREGLDIRVLQRDFFATREDLRRDYQLIVLSEVVCDFRSPADLRRMFELAAECLAPGGRLLFNVFLGRSGYVPDAAARELSQQSYSMIFTEEELAGALGDLPLALEASDPAYDYEKANLPAEAWPPTSWYVNWATGLDVFNVPVEQSPIELRWMVYRKPPHRAAGGPESAMV
jgi:SAM-dependent methyltransferase